MITNDVSTIHWKSSSTSVSPLNTNIFRRHKQKQWSPTRNQAEKSTDSWWFTPHCCGFRALPPHFPQPRTLWIMNPLLESPFCFKLMGKTSRESFTLLIYSSFFSDKFFALFPFSFSSLSFFFPPLLPSALARSTPSSSSMGSQMGDSKVGQLWPFSMAEYDSRSWLI